MLNGKHILVENCPGLGDVIMFTPGLRAIKEAYPGAIISVVSYARNLPIISRLPYIDHVYGIERGHLFGRCRPMLHLWQQDYVVFTTWQSQFARLARLMRVKHRAGICKEAYKKTGLFHRLLPEDNFDDPRYRAESAAQQLAVGLDIALTIDPQVDVSAPNEEERQAARAKMAAQGLEDGQPYAVLAPFANTEKNIPLPVVKEATHYLSEEYGLSCVFINGRKMECLEVIKNELGKNVIDLCGQTSLMEMAAVIQGARLAFTANSGPLHIASALKIATAVIFTNDNRPKWQPPHNCFPITADAPCAPCSRETEESCPHKRCLNNISFDMINVAFDAIMRTDKSN